MVVLNISEPIITYHMHRTYERSKKLWKNS